MPSVNHLQNPTERVALLGGTQSIRVLVADDEHLIADTLALILEMRGFSVNAVYSGEEAVESVEVFNPDVFITDVVMTGMSGIEAATSIQNSYPDCKVILFSGHIATEGLLRDSKVGFEIIAANLARTLNHEQKAYRDAGQQRKHQQAGDKRKSS